MHTQPPPTPWNSICPQEKLTKWLINIIVACGFAHLVARIKMTTTTMMIQVMFVHNFHLLPRRNMKQKATFCHIKTFLQLITTYRVWWAYNNAASNIY